MKIFTYKDEDVSQFPAFKERPWMPEGEGVEKTDDPAEADYIVCPAALHRIKSRNMGLRVDKALKVTVETLKHWKQYEHKHVFFDCSDFENSFNGTTATLIRCNVRDFMLADKNTIPWFWPVDDLKDFVSVPEDGFKFDAGFQGWLSTDTRKQAGESCKRVFGSKFNHRTFSDFFGHMANKAAQDERRVTFLRGQQETKVLLAPQSIPGVFPYRFYEAMSSGRVPALFCTGYHLPFQKEIDWDKCTLRYRAEEAPRAGELLKEFFNKTSDEQILEMGRYGREVWDRWLNRDKQPELVAYALRKKLGEI